MVSPVAPSTTPDLCTRRTANTDRILEALNDPDETDEQGRRGEHEGDEG